MAFIGFMNKDSFHRWLEATGILAPGDGSTRVILDYGMDDVVRVTVEKKVDNTFRDQPLPEVYSHPHQVDGRQLTIVCRKTARVGSGADSRTVDLDTLKLLKEQSAAGDRARLLACAPPSQLDEARIQASDTQGSATEAEIGGDCAE